MLNIYGAIKLISVYKKVLLNRETFTRHVQITEICTYIHKYTYIYYQLACEGKAGVSMLFPGC